MDNACCIQLQHREQAVLCELQGDWNEFVILLPYQLLADCKLTRIRYHIVDGGKCAALQVTSPLWS